MPRRQIGRHGFTLIELMVMITIFTAMLAVAMPPINNYLRTNQLDTQADRLAADLQFARSVSIATGTVVRFQGTAVGYTLTDPVDGTTLRQHNFDHCQLDADITADFFPWGMADSRVLNMSSGAGTRTITLLPTGIVEVTE
jgi:type II secretion system protein H